MIGLLLYLWGWVLGFMVGAYVINAKYVRLLKKRSMPVIESELESRLRRLGWVVVAAPFPDVVGRWEGAVQEDGWRVRKGPAEVRAPSAAEVARLVWDFESTAFGLRPVPPPERGPAPPPRRRSPILTPTGRVRRRQKRVSGELVRCGYMDERHGTYCGALVWLRGGETLAHAREAHGVADPKQVEAMFRPPRAKLGHNDEGGKA